MSTVTTSREPSRRQLSACTVVGCQRPIAGQGYCSLHYQRWRRYGDPTVVRVQRSRRAWTPNELAEIEDLIGQGWSDERLAKRFGCTVNGIRLARKRYGIPSRTEALLNCRVIAERLGIACSKSVARWIQRGWLRGRRGQRRGGNRQWYVTEDALLAFLEDPDHWHRWDPARIVDRDLREWAEELRAGVEFLTLSEVAERTFVQPKTVGQWIDKGWLPAVRHGNRLVRESDLAGFTLPTIGGLTRIRFLERRGYQWVAMDVSAAPAAWGRVHVLRRAA